MSELIPGTDDMTSAEKKKAREHNRRIAYAELEKENRNRSKIDMTEEEEKRAKAMLRKVLKEKFPEYPLDTE